MGDGVSVEVVSPKSPGHGQFAGASLEIEELLTISSNYEAEGKIRPVPTVYAMGDDGEWLNSKEFHLQPVWVARDSRRATEDAEADGRGGLPGY